MKMKTTCNDAELCILLKGDESSHEYQSALQHVDSCSACQVRLEQMAAESGLWQEAQEVLTTRDVPAADDVAGDRLAFPLNRSPIAWSESMAKSLLSPPSHPEMLGRIGRYEVERFIGSGGMGVVFKAYDTELNRPVAVKLLTPYLAENGSARKRFAREARAAAAVVDEHVVAIHNVEPGEDPQHPPFLVMKYIAGGSLQQRLDRDGPLDVCEILRIGMQTAKGLAAAHAQGLIHRDVTPSNILLDEGVDRALLTDFGLARAEDDACLTRSGFHPGTPHYMSPEQVRGEAIDGRSDLFSLGCVLYAMCVGRPPFRAETSYAVLRRITDDTARPIRELNPNVPDWLEQIVMKLLSKSREDRFDSADDVAELLEDCLAHVQHPTTALLPEGASISSPACRGRPPWGKLIAATAFAFSIMFAGVLIMLELNKGTLTIESDVDDVLICIMRGDQVAKRLSVTRAGKTIRIAAGNYVVGIDGECKDIVVENGSVFMKRGADSSVRIVSSTSYVAELPAGRSIELVGITDNCSLASEGWKPDGRLFGDGVGEWNSSVSLVAARDFLFRLDGLKDVPSLCFSLRGGRSHFPQMQPEQLPGPWRLRVGVSFEDIAKPRGSLFLRQEAGVVQVAYTDEPWGEWVRVSAADGTILSPLTETDEYSAAYDEFNVRGVAALSAESVAEGLPASPGLTLIQTLRHSQMNATQIRGIDSKGEEAWLRTARITHDPDTASQLPETRTWRLGKPLPDERTLTRFEFRLRPYRYLVTFENVEIDGPTEKPSEVKVSVESI